MPLVANTDLPSFTRLAQEGQEILHPKRATTQDIRELHIGFLNMMPDKALEATERQFLRLVGSCNRIAQFHVHPFSFDEIPRGEKAKSHIKKYYNHFDQLKDRGLDAMILSGANPVQSDMTKEPFWQPLQETVRWAKDNVCSVMCSCLATHAVVKQLWNIERYALPQKRWGVYSNRVTQHPHPLTVNIDSRFNAPHSHVYEVSAKQFEQAGLVVLAKSNQSDLHLAVSADGFRFVFFQGHPEYDAVSLLKEYKREVIRYLDGTRNDYPPYPENYFFEDALRILEDFEKEVMQCRGDYASLRDFPEKALTKTIDITWTDTGKAIINNWLGLVYQTVHHDPKKVFMDGINPENPLDLAKY